jgi:putative DNA primase/helicase
MKDIEKLKAATSQPAVPEDGVKLVSASAITPMPIDWLWDGYLAAGKLHLLAGTPGTGKTTIAMAFAATVSRGGRFPDGERAKSGAVLIWTAEDDPQDTLVPRLIASGADLTKVHFITGMVEEGKDRSFDPSQHLQELLTRASELGDVRLIIIDPIVSAVAGDGHKANDVRRALQPAVDLALALGCVVLGITHFSKGTSGRDPLERVTGSQAYGALARVVLVAAKSGGDEDGEPAQRFIARAKSNIGPDGGGFNYSLLQQELTSHPGVVASYVDWGDAIEGSARELLGDAESVDEEGSGLTGEAEQFLMDLLVNGPVLSKIAKRQAADNGISDKALRRARKSIGVVAKREGFGEDMRSTWCLPGVKPKTPSPTAEAPSAPTLPHSCPPINRGTNDTKDANDTNGKAPINKFVHGLGPEGNRFITTPGCIEFRVNRTQPADDAEAF